MNKEQQDRLVQLIEQHKAALQRFALNVTRNREDARELMSETIAIACQSFAKIRDEQSFLSYLFSIAVRRWRDHVRTRERERAISIDEIDELYTCGSQPDQLMAITELREAIDKLPVDYKESLILSEIVGLPHAEIAAIINVREGTVRVRVHRAKQQIRKLLNDTVANTTTVPVTDKQPTPKENHANT